MSNRPVISFRSVAGSMAVAGLVSLAGLGGCAKSAAQQQLDEIRSNPTPELLTYNERPDDAANHITQSFNGNVRGFWRDLGVLGMVEKPSRLSPYPIR